MTITHSDAHHPSGNDPVIDWLLDADPSIRWQVMRDLTDTPAEVVAAEEAVATVLQRRQGDGRWPLDVRHRDTLHQEFAGTVGAANRWITLHALRVLHWYARRV